MMLSGAAFRSSRRMSGHPIPIEPGQNDMNIVPKPQWSQFEESVTQLFALKGYAVQFGRLISGKKVDVFAEKTVSDFTRERIAIECKDYTRTIPTSEIKEIIGTVPALVGSGEVDIVLIVSSRDNVTPNARRLIEDTPGLQIITYDNLLCSFFDARPWLSKLISTYEQDPISTRYVPLQCRRHVSSLSATTSNEPKTFGLDEYVEQWISSPSSVEHISLLGDYGAGKTTFVYRQAYLQAKRYLANPGGERIPILINLREYSKALDVSALVTHVLVNKYLINTTYETFLELMSMGKVVLFLDGFDEMAMKVDQDVREKNFEALQELAVPNTKIILTGRPGYFLTDQELEGIFHADIPDDDPYAQVEAYISRIVKYEIFHLMPFDEKQIDTFLKLHYDDLRDFGVSDWLQVKSMIQSTYDLTDLASRPVLLDIIAKTLPRIQHAEGVLNPGKFYQIYTDFWINREYRKGEFRHLIDRESKELFVEQLAWLMFEGDFEAVHHADLFDLVR